MTQKLSIMTGKKLRWFNFVLVTQKPWTQKPWTLMRKKLRWKKLRGLTCLHHQPKSLLPRISWIIPSPKTLLNQLPVAWESTREVEFSEKAAIPSNVFQCIWRSYSWSSNDGNSYGWSHGSSMAWHVWYGYHSWWVSLNTLLHLHTCHMLHSALTFNSRILN